MNKWWPELILQMERAIVSALKLRFLSPVIVLMLLITVAGCSTMTPARYAVSVDANQKLKALTGTHVYLARLSPPADEDSKCRLMGPIKAGDGLTITEFIADAFNDEFKFADIHDENGLRLEGDVTEIEFSSSDGLTNGHWNLGMTLRSPNGSVVSSHVNYKFKSGFDAVTACNQTAQALGAAVQDLVLETVSDPRFKSLLE
jgi:hypothetical protein